MFLTSVIKSKFYLITGMAIGMGAAMFCKEICKIKLSRRANSGKESQQTQ